MSLKGAAQMLGVAPNTIRTRWKRGKIKGEMGNDGKVWVWVDPDETANDMPQNPRGSKRVSEAFLERSAELNLEPNQSLEISALRDHLKTLQEQLAIATAENAELRSKAADADRLRGENEGLRGQLDIRAEQLAELRSIMEAMQKTHADELQRWMKSQPAKGFFARLFGRTEKETGAAE